MWVFVCKQKTAYEMRISDWSSDVCSSDLASFFRTGFIAGRLGLPGFILPFLFVVHPEILGIGSGLLYTAFISAMALLGIVALNVMLEGYLFRPLTWPDRLILLPAALGLLHSALWNTLPEIGRASCRERVGPTV